MAQYPIPQFIEEESKITYFLTFRQFFFLVGGGAACLLIYFLVPFYLFIPLAIIVATLTIVLAFVKIAHRSIISIVLDFIGFSIGGKNYVWKKRTPTGSPKMTKKTEFKNAQEIIIAKNPEEKKYVKEIKK